LRRIQHKKGGDEMLYPETVESGTLELLRTLMQDNRLSGFLLAGGTNLALRLGHRHSVDLEKYKGANALRALRGLAYFDDIDFNVSINLTSGTFNWKEIEKRIHEMIRYENKVFATAPCL
jgi:hypothetical protein